MYKPSHYILSTLYSGCKHVMINSTCMSMLYWMILHVHHIHQILCCFIWNINCTLTRNSISPSLWLTGKLCG